MTPFRDEIDAGLGEVLRGMCRAKACLCPLTISPTFGVSETLHRAVAKNFPHAKAAHADGTPDDLKYLTSILVSTGWNLNDDVFDPAEVWASRKTPEDKPLNYDHDQPDIVGHMVRVSAVDKDGGEIDDETPLDELPPEFDLKTQQVLYYGYWSDADKKDRVDGWIEEINKGELFVSMEALFAAFDYALQLPSGEHRTIARNKSTSFLTKYLRAYSGPGVYQGAKVGRLLRQITFSGNGLVRVPANPESVILSTARKTFVSEAPSCDLPAGITKAGYEDKPEGNKPMSKPTDATTTPDVPAAVEVLKQAHAADLKTRDEKIAALEAQVKVLEKSIADERGLKEQAIARTGELEKERRELSRTAAVKLLGLPDEQVNDFVSKTLSYTDEVFSATVELVKASRPAPVNTNDGTATAGVPDLTRPQNPTPAPALNVPGSNQDAGDLDAQINGYITAKLNKTRPTQAKK